MYTDGVYWMRLSELRRRRTEPPHRRHTSHTCAAAEGVVDNDDELSSQTQPRQVRRRPEDEPERSPTTSEKLVGASYVRSAGASSIRAKRRSVQMLTVVVVLFFVCWTPMYVLQTWRRGEVFQTSRSTSNSHVETYFRRGVSSTTPTPSLTSRRPP